ncbi:MAG: hypothetical protein ABSE49_00590 [Polyangiaceae bacterium]|jgi:hypothetical protein
MRPTASAARWAIALVSAGLACAPDRETATPAPSAVSPPSSPPPSVTATASLVAPPPPPAPPAPPELPRGGRTLFPDYRLVGFCGTPGAPALGPLLDHPANKAEKLLSYANQYDDGRKILPVFELIAVVVQAGGGADGKYRARVLDATVDEYLAAARQNKGLLLLNIQPGQSDFLTEVQRFERYLREPDVGVALDPEWAMLPKQTPNHFYGQTNGETISGVIAYLSDIVTKNGLPEKALVFHKENNYVVKNEDAIVTAPGVAVIRSIDGYGNKWVKANTYAFLMRTRAPGVHPGFKLFFDEDRQNGQQLMSPAEVMKLVPPPEYVMYE